MTAFDFFACALLLASGVLGLVRGLFREVLALAAYAVAFGVALWWGPVVYTWLDMVEHALARMALAYGVLFIVVLFAVGLLGRALAALASQTGLSPVDHTLGGLFGVLRGVLVLLILVALAGYTPLPQEDWWRDAMFSDTLVRALVALRHGLPPELAAWLPYQ